MNIFLTMVDDRLVDQQISPSYNGHRVTIKVNRSNEAISYNQTSQVHWLINYLVTNLLLFQVSADQNLSISSNTKHRTSSVQNLPTSKLSRDRSNSDNGEFREFNRETFFWKTGFCSFSIHSLLEKGSK